MIGNMENFKRTSGDWKEDIGIDLLGHNDELMQIIVYSKQINTHNVAHVFGLSQDEVMANAKLISCAPEYHTELSDLVWLIEKGATMEELQERIIQSKQLIKKATEI